MRGRLLLIFALAAFVCPAGMRAQAPPLPQPAQPEILYGDADGDAPAHVAHVDGAVSLEREGRTETSPLNMPLLSGDRLRTADGRVEVLFADGSTLHLDMRSTLDVQSDDLVRLTEGRLRLNILGPARAVAYRIDSPAGSARITQAGEYRLALLRGETETQLELAVVRGAAEVFTDQGTTPVRAGERAYASAGLAPSYAYAYNSANWDAFDRWSEERRDVRLGVSSQYLPSDMQPYAPVLDESGDWRYTESYGYAWYPRVTAEWRPYYHGRWASYPRYGWTWIGADRFAWPTHHYGRWGFSAGVWFWLPSSRWAPAYVSWGYAPGYVSWCPLGFDNRPIFGINTYRSGPGHYSSWRGWTAVSASHFGSRDHRVDQRAVNWDRFNGQRPNFENRPSAPGSSRDIAVSRNATPIRWAGSRSGSSRFDGSRATGSPRLQPRDDRAQPDARTTRETPRYINRGDDIVRSRTERPTAREGSAGIAVPRTDTRTVPDRPARPVDGAQGRPVRPERERDAPAFERPEAQDRSRTSGASGVQVPSYQPSYRTPREAPAVEPQSRPSDPARSSGPGRTESRGEASQDRPRAYERSRPGADAAPPERGPGPGRVERAPAPSRVEGQDRGERRQPPPPRSDPNPGNRGERAAPPPPANNGSGIAVPRRGRGGV